MLTVKDVVSTFVEKGLHINLPLPDDTQVKKLDVLERRKIPGGLALLLSIKYVDERGQDTTEVFFCEGRLDKKPVTEIEIRMPAKASLLPIRSAELFENDDEVRAYLAEAMGHLLLDKGYVQGHRDDVDLYYELAENAFFLDVCVRLDDEALEKAEKLVALRLECGVDHEYGILVPAFQESLGVSLLNQDRWIWRNDEHLSANRIGVYAVDNWNPNLIYAFTVHPRPRELKRFFMTTGSQWQMIRSRYVATRAMRRREAAGVDEQ